MFIAIQSAVYSGYVDVDWKKVQHDAVAKVDTVRTPCLRLVFTSQSIRFRFELCSCFNFFYQDGDGELTTADLKNYWITVKKVLTNKVPSAGGFSIGFLYGVRYS